MSQPRRAKSAAQVFVRIKLSSGGVLGPGKAELLECVDRLGSISAAARQMGMSYRQAWKLIETMNEVFREPVVETSQGGASGGGAALSNVGKTVLRCYRAMHQKATRSTVEDLKTITDLLAANPVSRFPKSSPARRSVSAGITVGSTSRR
jgi:molybdate transport system regulatory protein